MPLRFDAGPGADAAATAYIRSEFTRYDYWWQIETVEPSTATSCINIVLHIYINPYSLFMYANTMPIRHPYRGALIALHQVLTFIFFFFCKQVAIHSNPFSCVTHMGQSCAYHVPESMREAPHLNVSEWWIAINSRNELVALDACLCFKMRWNKIKTLNRRTDCAHHEHPCNLVYSALRFDLG